MIFEEFYPMIRYKFGYPIYDRDSDTDCSMAHNNKEYKPFGWFYSNYCFGYYLDCIVVWIVFVSQSPSPASEPSPYSVRRVVK